jgi:formamidopyrimidine-DNA glycosylase
MPELPEVEIVCRGLNKKLAGDSVIAVDVFRSESIAYPKFATAIIGKTFEKFWRRGKYILASLSDGSGFAAHLRMSGRLLLDPPIKRKSQFLRVLLKLKSARELHFEDMRVFGRLWYIPKNKTFGDIIPTLNELGIEPLDHLSGRKLLAIFKNKKQSIKSALMDQRLIAGIGNIYADESLFHAGIHPLTPAGRLKLEQLDSLSRAIMEVLKRAIEAGGSSIRDYRDSEGVNGQYQDRAQVYGRTKKPCRVCGHAIERVKVAGRSTHFCPICQRVARSRKKVSKKS